jgi:hypothetical protein
MHACRFFDAARGARRESFMVSLTGAVPALPAFYKSSPNNAFSKWAQILQNASRLRTGDQGEWSNAPAVEQQD